jgi:hypothetical protein
VYSGTVLKGMISEYMYTNSGHIITIYDGYVIKIEINITINIAQLQQNTI